MLKTEVPPQQEQPEECDGKEYEPFHLRERIEEMILYAWEPVTQFPRKDRALADKLKELMTDLYELSIQIDNRHMRKTTMQEHKSWPDLCESLLDKLEEAGEDTTTERAEFGVLMVDCCMRGCGADLRPKSEQMGGELK